MRKNRFGLVGVFIGGLAVLLSLLHFWAGPFSPPPSLESVLAERAEAIRRATIEVLEGKPSEPVVVTARYDIDQIIEIAVALLGGLAIILAAVSFSLHESNRASVSAATLGIGAIAFQYISSGI